MVDLPSQITTPAQAAAGQIHELMATDVDPAFATTSSRLSRRVGRRHPTERETAREVSWLRRLVALDLVVLAVALVWLPSPVTGSADAMPASAAQLWRAAVRSADAGAFAAASELLEQSEASFSATLVERRLFAHQRAEYLLDAGQLESARECERATLALEPDPEVRAWLVAAQRAVAQGNREDLARACAALARRGEPLPPTVRRARLEARVGLR